MAESKKQYVAIADCGNTLNNVLFTEAFGKRTFFYASDTIRANAIKTMKARADKKHIPVTFKLLNHQTEEKVEETNEQ